jgi:Ca2+-binding RTX toxin-like protein
VLRGSTGADVLTGGAGADLFVYALLTDSTVAVGGRDTITDFVSAQGDKIDLRRIDAVDGGTDDAFRLMGSFLAGDAGRLVVTAVGSGSLVQGDTDGDGDADFSILVATAVVGGGDFLF